jgi:hypothetical protein
LEVVITMTVMVILVAGFGTALYSTVNDARRTAVLNQLDRIKKGLVGDPRVIAPGERDIRRFGYLGDIGTLPSSLSFLVTAGTSPNALPDFRITGHAADANVQLGAGWRGPYVPPNSLTDPWGQAIEINPCALTGSLTGATVAAEIRSSGPDGMMCNSDDSVVEIYKSETFTEVKGYVKDPFSATVPGVAVILSTVTGGSVQNVPGTTDDLGLYSFPNVPAGERVLQLAPVLAFTRNTAFTSGGALNDVEFVVESLHRLSAASTFNKMKLTFTASVAADYAAVLMNGISVFSGAAASGTTIGPFTNQTVSGTGVVQESIHFFEASGLIMLVPDVIVGTVGTGGTLKIEVKDFEEVGTASNIDMTGVTFFVEFLKDNQTVSKTSFTTKRKP